jgi:hypothetical protein
MSDRLLFSLTGLGAALMIALALVWPQGLGARSPGPFGHTPVQQTAAAKAARARAEGKGAAPAVLTMAPGVPAAASGRAP